MKVIRNLLEQPSFEKFASFHLCALQQEQKFSFCLVFKVHVCKWKETAVVNMLGIVIAELLI